MNPYEEKQEAERQREQQQRPAEGMRFDPVCGAEVEAQPGLQVGYAGETYNFCSDECRDKFEANPARWVKAH
jgi:YHS domain-containing protein